MSVKSALVTVALVAAVVAIPLILKARRDAVPVDPAAPCAPGHETEGACGPSATEAQAQIPRFVDLGTTTCAPCKVMLGVMSELEARYPGALHVELINVHDQPDALKKYGVHAIPTQIFYAPGGRELFRHTGVMRPDAVVAKWSQLGYALTPPAEPGH